MTSTILYTKPSSFAISLFVNQKECCKFLMFLLLKKRDGYQRQPPRFIQLFPLRTTLIIVFLLCTRLEEIVHVCLYRVDHPRRLPIVLLLLIHTWGDRQALIITKKKLYLSLFKILKIHQQKLAFHISNSY